MLDKYTGETTEDGDTTGPDDDRIGRRSYLKLAAVTAGSVATMTGESEVVRAATNDDYGQGGYGQIAYGGTGFAVATAAAGSVDTTSVTLNGELSDLDGASSADCYFEWRRTGASDWSATAAQTLRATGPYSESLSGLDSGTDYEYRAVGNASDGDAATAGTVTFSTTTDDPPAVTTGSASNVTTTEATLSGSLDGLGGASSVDCDFQWRRSGASSWSNTATQTLSETGSFSATLSGLEDGVQYEYRAVAAADDGDTAEGDTATVTTLDDPPTVSTGSASSVTDSAATLNGSLDGLGGASSADCDFQWRRSGASSWSNTATQTLSETGSFSADLTSLSGNTDYEYRAVASASDGDGSIGTTASFATASSNSPPAIDSYTVTEAGSPNPHAEVTADWAVSDPDGDLDSVTVDVADSSGTVVDSATANVSGGSASGTEQFKIKRADGGIFDVTLTVTDAAGRSASTTRSVSE